MISLSFVVKCILSQKIIPLYLFYFTFVPIGTKIWVSINIRHLAAETGVGNAIIVVQNRVYEHQV